MNGTPKNEFWLNSAYFWISVANSLRSKSCSYCYDKNITRQQLSGRVFASQLESWVFHPRATEWIGVALLGQKRPSQPPWYVANIRIRPNSNCRRKNSNKIISILLPNYWEATTGKKCVLFLITGQGVTTSRLIYWYFPGAVMFHLRFIQIADSCSLQLKCRHVQVWKLHKAESTDMAGDTVR